MSDNKFKYFTVERVETYTVRANSKSDAGKLALGRRGVSGQVLGSTGEMRINRISAAEAKGTTASS